MDTLGIIEKICSLPAEKFTPASVLLVAAHPDDEVLGVGSRLAHLGKAVFIVWMTDGAPRNIVDAQEAGFSSREKYAKARRRESESALAKAGLLSDQCRRFELVDRESMYHLAWITGELVSIAKSIYPQVILTHSYEGGHPDHDSAAFAAAAAVSILKTAGQALPLVEFTSYNAGPSGNAWCTDFLPDSSSPVRTVELSPEEWKMKQMLMECYESQKWIMNAFHGKTERYRPTPGYDFGKPPHSGKLLYEKMPWGIQGLEWRALAGQAEKKLGIRGGH